MVRVATVPAEDPGLLCSTHIRQFTAFFCSSSCRGPDSLWPPPDLHHMVHKNSHRHTYIKIHKGGNKIDSEIYENTLVYLLWNVFLQAGGTGSSVGCRYQ